MLKIEQQRLVNKLTPYEISLKKLKRYTPVNEFNNGAIEVQSINPYNIASTSR